MPRSLVVITASLVFSLACISPAAAQELGPAELLPELRDGGLVIASRDHDGRAFSFIREKRDRVQPLQGEHRRVLIDGGTDIRNCRLRIP